MLLQIIELFLALWFIVFISHNGKYLFLRGVEMLSGLGFVWIIVIIYIVNTLMKGHK